MLFVITLLNRMKYFSSGAKRKLKLAEIWMLFFSAVLQSTPFYQVNR